MTPDQRHAIARFRDASGDLAALTTVLDIAETKAHAALGLKPVMDDETTLALETALIEYRTT